ncbi:unnamed protein product [Oikopleura dioica]|uniref:Uncharacterized protein n=1 Tax=Oikopleura dioica TaxID=34765 RepID=E4YL45_OIKDI|nr:unnamed protein product [Oikopleura dioica]
MSKKTDKKIAVVPFRMIVLAAEELDFILANEEKLAIILAEDLTYRLQVLVTKSKKHANRCRRNVLLPEDIDQSLDEFGESPLLAANEPETGVIAYEGKPLYYHIPQPVNLKNLSLEDGPAMTFSPLTMEKFPIFVDGKPTKFLKKPPKTFQTKSRYYSGEWDLYLTSLTHGLGEEETERVAFFANDFQSNPNLNQIIPQLRYIIQQCCMSSVAERSLRILQLLLNLLKNPFIDVTRLENDMIALAKFCIEDTGPEIIPGKEGLETAVQERASAFYNQMFTHGSFCQDKVIQSLDEIRIKDGHMFALLSCGKRFLPNIRQGEFILPRVAFLRRNMRCLPELIIEDEEPAISMMLIEPVSAFPSVGWNGLSLIFPTFRRISSRFIKSDILTAPKAKKRKKSKNLPAKSVQGVFDHHEIQKSTNIRINYGKPKSIQNTLRRPDWQNRNNLRFESGIFFYGIQKRKNSFSSLLL